MPVIPLDAQPTNLTTLAPQAAPLPAPEPAALKTSGGRGLPVAVDIPAIGVHVHSGLMALGLDHGAPSVPPTSTPQVLGYSAYSNAPCQAGPMKVPFTLLGHIDGNHKAGVFANLKNLKPGNTVTIGLDTGVTCTYRITALKTFKKTDLLKKDAEQAAEAWGPKPVATIHITSCGGKFIGPPLFYDSNLIGEGTLIS